jgi:hypothetical protein
VDIDIQPFKTSHHQQAVDARFLSRIEEYVRSQILPQLEIKENLSVKLSTDYDDEKFLGPNSVCKYRYNLLVKSERDHESEEVRLSFQYDMESEEIWPYRGPFIIIFSISYLLYKPPIIFSYIFQLIRAGTIN